MKSPGIAQEDIQTLLAGCLQKNRESQNRLYNLFAPKMMSVCLRYCNNTEEAEDMLQEGFVKAFKHLAQYRNDGPFEGWLRRIMVNGCLRKYETLSKQKTVLGFEGLENTLITLPDAYNSMANKDLLALLHSLPPACRLVFNLYVFEGMKHREIATLLGISEGTSKSNLYDARSILKNRLENLDAERTKKSAYG
jgi:RNA polymerase sigma-70 factor (ECF subfamily)